MRARTSKAALLALSLSVVVFAATTVGFLWHNHPDGSESSCQICHIGHLPVIQPITTAELPVPVVIVRAPCHEVLKPYFEPTAQNAPPRAPPAESALHQA